MSLTLKELEYQLIQLETRLELRIGDVPAAQIIRAATRKIELARRIMEPMKDCDPDIREWLDEPRWTGPGETN